MVINYYISYFDNGKKFLKYGLEEKKKAEETAKTHTETTRQTTQIETGAGKILKTYLFDHNTKEPIELKEWKKKYNSRPTEAELNEGYKNLITHHINTMHQ